MDVGLTIPEDTPYQWEICIGNGWRECPVEVGYVGNVIIAALNTSGDPPVPADMPTFSPTIINTPFPTRGPQNAPTPVPTGTGSAAPTPESIIIEERCGLDAIVSFET